MYCSLIVGIVFGLIYLVRFYYKRKFSYWSNRNVNQLSAKIPFGSVPSSFSRKKTVGILIADMYKEMKSRGWKDGGVYFFTRPQYFLLDLDYIKHVLTKDFQHFVDRGTFVSEDEPLTQHLFAIGGQKWRNLRTKLTPTFTSGKLKHMFPIFLECGEGLSRAVASYSRVGDPVSIKDVLGCFTTDVIGSCAFGLDCGSFDEKDSPFRANAQKFFTTSPLRNFLRGIAINFPAVPKIIGFKFIPKDINDFFMGVVNDTEKLRRENNIKRNDFFQLLLDLNQDKKLTMDEVAAQAFVFFLAGFETSSSTMTFVLYELAKHPQMQDKVREEIEQVLKNKQISEITYEDISQMTYLGQVIDETLRMFPPVSFITRKCVEDYQHPFRKDLVIEKGTGVIIPIFGIHYDAEHYPEPEKFDPERFSVEGKKDRHQYAYLPFGEGPRMCIGLRFGLLQAKVGLVTLLKQYKFKVNSKTQEPIAFSKSSFVLAAQGDIWLDVQKL